MVTLALALLLILGAGCIDPVGDTGKEPPARQCHEHTDCEAAEACGTDRFCRACTLLTCESAGRECGPFPDGCRGTLECGSCAADEACDTEGRCGQSDTALCDEALACGEVNLHDRSIDCGECAAGLCEEQHCCSCGAGPDGIPCGLPCELEAASPGPAPRYGASLAYLPEEDRAFLFGGEDDTLRDGLTAFGDLWSRSPGGGWVEEHAAGELPSPRAKGGVAVVGDALLLFGGWEGWDSREDLPCIFDDLFQLRREAGILTWTKLDPGAGSRPLARFEPGVAATDDGRLFVYGGFFLDSGELSGCEPRTDLPSRLYGDLWSWGGTSWTEHPILGATPAPRSGPSLVHDPVRGKLVLFGGRSATALLDDTWEYDLATGSWEERAPAHRPSARTEHAAAWSGGGAIVFGGNLAEGLSSDELWRWDGADWTELTPEAGRPVPSKRRCASLTAAGEGSVLLFGGFCIADCALVSSNYLDDSWLLPVP